MTSAARRRAPLAVGLSMSSSTDKTPRKEGNDKTPRKEGIDQDASILESIKGTPSGAKPPKDWLEPMTAQELAKSRGSLPVIFEDVSKAAYYIRGSVRRTPCEQSPGLSELTGCEIYVKEETNSSQGRSRNVGHAMRSCSCLRSRRQKVLSPRRQATTLWRCPITAGSSAFP